MGEGTVNDKEILPYMIKLLSVKENQNKLALETKNLPERTKEISEIFGSPITYDLDWSSFSTPEEYSFVDNCAFHRINMAFRTLKKPMLEQLKKTPIKTIKLKNVKNVNDKKLELNLQSGVLSLTCAFGLGLSGCFSDSQIFNILKTNIK